MTSIWRHSRSALARRVEWVGVQLAVKSAVAAGVAFQVGTMMPAPLSDQPYYAPLGALVVMYPALLDSIAVAARSLVAIALGMAVALVAQTVASANPVTVGLVVAVSVAVGAIPALGDQRSWVTFASLFTLTVGAARPEDYVLAYGGQFLVGAAIGLLTNYLILPPLGWDRAQRCADALRRGLVDQLETVADLVVDQPTDRSEWEARLLDLQPAVQQMRVAARQALRARRANPRAENWAATEASVMQRVRSLERVGLMTQEIASVLIDVSPDELATAHASGRELRLAIRSALTALARVLADPDGPDGASRSAADAHAAIDHLLDRLRSTEFAQFEHHLLAGDIAVTARRCLAAFVYGAAPGHSIIEETRGEVA